jgi:chemotaxis protein methyltransferase CheR
MSFVTTAPAIETTAFNYVCRLVFERSGICLSSEKQYLVQLRIMPLARAAGFTDLSQYLNRLRQLPFGQPHTDVIEAMTTNETSFFRDVAPFEALRQHILPEVLRKRPPTARIRIWCAACSTGQEPYSISMMVRQHFPQLVDRLEIHATDLANSVLTVAKAGRFSQLEVNRGLPAPMLLRYFSQEGTEWQLNSDIRKMVEFRPVNLIEAWPLMRSFDIIFIRNVMIYFDAETKRGILRKTRQVLNPDGFLFLGSAETTMGLDESYHRQTMGKAVCYRPQKPDPVPASAPAASSLLQPARACAA